ncbi:glutamyl-tRNA synthetase [Cordyceps fumosorosea ARSEF 2679]|uniref:Glutamate--tRNA ligase, mitochondrial n=1 Tax=Cordyceps fumosorosea (strain ARSEF 2679) TaxID=1081104 RepID=A0A167Q3Q6_CORFA|nr:glutamyl-tRNA synthetase [Cordyceps fumosorosea ARSEF 2679]OAA57255.1 glutamyl-tRNA synthetase [Cordyceps fumosorosea ARSEF 2679]
MSLARLSCRVRYDRVILLLPCQQTSARRFHACASQRNPEAPSSSASSPQPKRGLGLLRGSKTPAAKDTTSKAAATRYILGQSADLPIRARFAPSPTGYLHLGSLRTALFNNVAARASKDGGAFILRIEDTDQQAHANSFQSRLVHDAEARLLEDLSWAGLSWDEGPDCGGPYGPYRQSERLPIYQEHAQTLLDNGHAYRCFCSPAQLDAQRQALHEAGRPTLYPGTCRAVDPAESSRRAAAGEPHVVRFHGGGETGARPALRDAIYGHFQKKEPEEDFILLKSDGFPTYHFACVVDDHLMKITHVIRGEEWLISAPKHVALYHAFGWQPPIFAHLGLLVNPDGTKLSKRNADVDLSTYKAGRVFPAALLAWLANLGSSFKPSAKPPRSVADIAEALTFKFTRGGIKLNVEKLDHFNGRYRDLLLREPLASLPPREAALMRTHLLSPTLAAVSTAATTGVPSWPRAPLPLERVPPLLRDAPDAYVHAVLASRDGGFRDAADVVRQHPYLFFRPPADVYRASVAATPPDARVLDALRGVLEREDEDDGIWGGRNGQRSVEALRTVLDRQGVDPLTMHNVLRLVGAGGQDVVSQSSGRMLATLGRDEWRHRLRCVQQIV